MNLQYLEIVRFKYPDKEEGAVIWKDHTAVILNPLYNGLTHALRLDILDATALQRLVGFLWSETYGDLVKRDPLAKRLIAGFGAVKEALIIEAPIRKVKAPYQFYHTFIKPLIRTFPITVYRTYNRRNMRGVEKISVKRLFSGR